MKLTVSQIVGALPSLTKAERVIVRAALDQFDPLPKVLMQAEEVPLWEAMMLTIGSTMPLDAFMKNSLLRTTWNKYAQTAVRFIDQNWPTASKTAKYGLMRFCFGLIEKDLNEREITLSVGSMTANLGRFVQVFEAAFPGYRESGLQGLILKRMEAGGGVNNINKSSDVGDLRSPT